MAKPNQATVNAGKEIAQRMLEFINSSPSPFHATETCVKRLEAGGYKRLSEKASWVEQLQRNGKYFFTRNNSSLIAFSIGGKFAPENGLKIVGAHTDSPNLMIKPSSTTGKFGYQQVSVATYGGGLWHTWFDRDLTVAGRVIVKSKDGDKCKLSTKLVHIPRSVLFVPNLCIHLQSATEREALKLNKETNICPLLCTSLMNQLNGDTPPTLPSNDIDRDAQKSIQQRHPPALLKLIASQIGCEIDDIVEWDMNICDTQPAELGGIYQEFVHAPRIDNLSSSYCALEALLQADPTLPNESQVRVIAFFDNEEVGSDSVAGAGCNHIETLLRRLVTKFGSQENVGNDLYEAAIRNSFMISSDSAHLIHPNYPEKHHELHRPQVHFGPVLKFNANQRYATNSVNAGIIRALGEKNGIPIQEFSVRNDTACGSTIGPILSTRTGIRTIDLGLPQLAMHSCRETCGTLDVHYLKELMKVFFEQYDTVFVEDAE